MAITRSCDFMFKPKDMHWQEIGHGTHRLNCLAAIRECSRFTVTLFGFCTQQTIELSLRDAIALARPLLQSHMVEDGDVAALVLYEPDPLQPAGDNCNASPPHSIIARNSCVRGNSVDCMRSYVIRSQRQHRCSIE